MLGLQPGLSCRTGINHIKPSGQKKPFYSVLPAGIKKGRQCVVSMALASGNKAAKLRCAETVGSFKSGAETFLFTAASLILLLQYISCSFVLNMPFIACLLVFKKKNYKKHFRSFLYL